MFLATREGYDTVVVVVVVCMLFRTSVADGYKFKATV